MEDATTKPVPREHREWHDEQLAAEARNREAAGTGVKPSAGALHARLDELGADFGMFRR
ncbi:MAG: hypothetical protein ACR2N5_00200 [Solirubrobacterales bacterium]